MKQEIFDDLRPFRDEEVPSAMQRISADPLFLKAIQYFFPDKSEDEIPEFLNSIQTIHDFQIKIMYHVIKYILDNTSDGATFSGIEKLDPKQPYLFISNHRDIFFDTCLLQFYSYLNDFPTTQISFGKNLMITPTIVDFGKINKMYTVYREGKTAREMYQHSKNLSDYIRKTIEEEKESIWIAQRNGRTKDGADDTQTGLLQMLNLSQRKKSAKEALVPLNIVPMSISYEFEPCDNLKTQELFASKSGPYKKLEGEDLKSILNGITEPKGRIHVYISEPMNDFISTISGDKNNHIQIEEIRNEINRRIISGYKCWTFNYVAADLIEGKNNYQSNYDESDIERFHEFCAKRLSEMKGDKKELKEMFVRLYANPVLRKEKS